MKRIKSAIRFITDLGIVVCIFGAVLLLFWLVASPFFLIIGFARLVGIFGEYGGHIRTFWTFALGVAPWVIVIVVCKIINRSSGKERTGHQSTYRSFYPTDNDSGM